MKYLLFAMCVGPLLAALLFRFGSASGAAALLSVFGAAPTTAQTVSAPQAMGAVQPVSTQAGLWGPNANAAAPNAAIPPGVAMNAQLGAATANSPSAPAPSLIATAPAAPEFFAPAPGTAQPPAAFAPTTNAYDPPVSATAPTANAYAAPTSTTAPTANAYDAPAATAAATAGFAAAPSADPLLDYGPPPAPLIDPRRFTEGHWQGIEVIPKTAKLAQMLGIPPNAQGVVIDDVTLPADLQGFQAGDLVVSIAQVATPDIVSFIQATDRVRDRRRAEVEILRGGQQYALVLTALLTRLGNANGETPPMIPAGARMPHGYLGACTNCHRIGTTGTLPVDQGDAMTKAAPQIRAGSRCPHRDRGACSSCHDIVP